jgi:hypothetical protein
MLPLCRREAALPLHGEGPALCSGCPSAFQPRLPTGRLDPKRSALRFDGCEHDLGALEHDADALDHHVERLEHDIDALEHDAEALEIDVERLDLDTETLAILPQSFRTPPCDA